MKRIFSRPTLATTALAFLLSTGSCDFLDVKPTSSYDAEQAFSNVTNATSAVLGIYDLMQGDNTYGIRLNLYYPYDTDEMQSSQGEPDGGRRDITRYRVTTGNSEILNSFTDLYRGIERANICIEQIPLMAAYSDGSKPTDQQALRRLHGEALTLRAQFYGELLRNWGDVPAPMTPSVAGKDISVLHLPAADRRVVYDQLLSDLALASQLVPWRTQASTSNERITKGAVKALRARMALARGGYMSRNLLMERTADYKDYYRMALAECDTLMQNRAQHRLNPDFRAVFKNINELRQDNAFGEIMFEVSAAGGNSNSDSKLGYYNGTRINSNSVRFGGTQAAVIALPTLFYAYDSLDVRRDVTVVTYQITAASAPAPNNLSNLTDGKFRRDWRVPLIPGPGSSVQNFGYNWPIIRFADVLLMFAEAENELNGPTAAARTALLEVRTRGFGGNATRAAAGLSLTSSADFFNAIVNERFLEFGGEGIRKYDLLRWNLLGTKISEARAQLTALKNRTGAYARVPQYVYWRAVGDQLQFARSLYRPSPTVAPTGFTRADWQQTMTSSTTQANMIDGLAKYYVPGAGKELVPFHQSVLDANPNLRQNAGY